MWTAVAPASRKSRRSSPAVVKCAERHVADPRQPLDPPLCRPEAVAGELPNHNPATGTDEAHELAGGCQALLAVEEAEERDREGEIELARGEGKRGRVPFDEPCFGRLRPRGREHRRVAVEPCHLQPLLGEPGGVDAGSAADVERALPLDWDGKCSDQAQLDPMRRRPSAVSYQAS